MFIQEEGICGQKLLNNVERPVESAIIVKNFFQQLPQLLSTLQTKTDSLLLKLVRHTIKPSRMHESNIRQFLIKLK